MAERALQEGLPLIDPLVVYQEFRVKKLDHQRLYLSGGGVLTGKTLLSQLAPAEEVVVFIGTIGGALEAFSSAILTTDPVYGLALDGVGSAAVEALVEAACAYFGQKAEAKGLEATLPLNPGMVGWPVEKGHQELFRLVDPGEAGIYLTEGGMMIPQKSLSVVIGFGEESRRSRPHM